MKKQKNKKKKIWFGLLIFLIVIIVGLGGYVLYGAYQINQLAEMTFKEMLDYTTKNNQEALITVGIIKDGEITYQVYGENGMEVPFEEKVYEIGSITKTFTTSLLAKAINEGKITLEDPIDQYLNLTNNEYYPTIQKLVTHTSGYKGYYFERPMISNFLQRKNHYYEISKEMLIKRIEKINLENREYDFVYSNFGVSVLGAVLEEIYETNFVTLMNDHITHDLGLRNTKILLGSYDLKDVWEWSPTDAYIPAGAIVSDINDMMQYLKIQLDQKNHETWEQVDGTTKSYEKMGIRIDAVGLGWMFDDQNQIIWHNGGTGHYNSYIGLDKEKQIGVVILSNLPPKYRIPATVMGIELLTSLQKP